MPIEGNTGGGEGDSESGSRRSAPRATDGRKTSTGEKAKNGGAVTFETSLIAWLILFVLGGGLLTLYYAGIGYFPLGSGLSCSYICIVTATIRFCGAWCRRKRLLRRQSRRRCPPWR